VAVGKAHDRLTQLRQPGVATADGHRALGPRAFEQPLRHEGAAGQRHSATSAPSCQAADSGTVASATATPSTSIATADAA
jgi:hypothetical protein